MVREYVPSAEVCKLNLMKGLQFTAKDYLAAGEANHHRSQLTPSRLSSARSRSRFSQIIIPSILDNADANVFLQKV